MAEEILFVERYRPQTIKECILPKEMEETFQKMVDKGVIPNLLLSGSQGSGKTTVARALARELGYDLLYVNGSEEGRYLDTLRNKIKQFATSVSMSGNRKVVLIDELDNTTLDVQTALRGFIESVSKNCSFIFTCNYPNKIIDPLVSRCAHVEFAFPPEERPDLAIRFFRRCIDILDQNEIRYKKQVLSELIMKYMPDWRRVLNELQRYGSRGEIDEGIFKIVGSIEVTELARMLKAKKFKDIREWVALNPQMELRVIARQLYENLDELCVGNTKPRAIIILADYQYKEAFVSDREINTMACLIELMAEVEWK